MAYIPYEITMIILSYLPVKSLLRFKCVSKSWRLWISNPKFELSNNQLRQGAIAMMTYEKYSGITSSFRFINNQQLTLEELGAPFMIRDIDESYRGTFRVLGSCHGLILINFDKHIYLWNPATRFYSKMFDLDDLDHYNTNGGICFDSSKNVYKVVLIMSNRHDDDDKFVIVASLVDKKWRHVEYPYDMSSIGDGITLHGRIHYRLRVSCKYDHDEYEWNCLGFHDEIIYFDPITEKFHMFCVIEPKCGQDDENIILGIGTLNECLCMIHLDNYVKRNVEILVMKEYGVNKSWTSLFIIRNLEFDPCYDVVPLFMTKNGEFVLITETVLDTNVLVYNSKNDNIQDIQRVDGRKEYLSCTFCYVESLILPEELCRNR